MGSNSSRPASDALKERKEDVQERRQDAARKKLASQTFSLFIDAILSRVAKTLNVTPFEDIDGCESEPFQIVCKNIEEVPWEVAKYLLDDLCENGSTAVKNGIKQAGKVALGVECEVDFVWDMGPDTNNVMKGPGFVVQGYVSWPTDQKESESK